MRRRRTNVLLITCDALRADHVGPPPGGGESLTPRLDGLAAGGVTFRHAVSQGFRTPISMPSLFTGQYPSRMGWFSIPSPFALRRQVTGVLLGPTPTLAERLAAGGYRTAGIHSNPLLSRLFGYGRGFELFDDGLFLADARLPARLTRWAYRVPQLVRVAGHLPAAAVNRKAGRWLGDHRAPFFLWLHYMDTHGPYCSRPGVPYWRRVGAQVRYQKAVSRPAAITPAEREQLLGHYRDQVRYADAQIGALLDSLSRAQLDDMLVVVTADHGEEFGEHGHYSHHSTLAETLLRVPLILKLPGGRHAGRVIDTPVAHVQLVPTVLDVLDLPIPAELDGPSLLPLLEGRPAAALECVLSEAKAAPDYKACIRSGPWKLVVDRRRGGRRLHHLEDDPGEDRDVAADAPDVAERLAMRLERTMAELSDRAPLGAGDRDVDGATVDRLRDLGYL
jgi:arylsulfatase